LRGIRYPGGILPVHQQLDAAEDQQESAVDRRTHGVHEAVGDAMLRPDLAEGHVGRAVQHDVFRVPARRRGKAN